MKLKFRRKGFDNCWSSSSHFQLVCMKITLYTDYNNVIQWQVGNISCLINAGLHIIHPSHPGIQLLRTRNSLWETWSTGCWQGSTWQRTGGASLAPSLPSCWRELETNVARGGETQGCSLGQWPAAVHGASRLGDWWGADWELKGKTEKGDIIGKVFYRPPNQEDQAGEAAFQYQKGPTRKLVRDFLQ